MSDFNNYRPQIEVLSASDGIRRRHWSDDDKLRVVEESFVGHRQVAATARRHGICRSLLTTWRRLYRNGELGASHVPSFAPVTVTKGVLTPQSPGPGDPHEPARDTQVEISLPNGRRLIVSAGVDTEALARLLLVVDRQ